MTTFLTVLLHIISVLSAILLIGIILFGVCSIFYNWIFAATL